MTQQFLAVFLVLSLLLGALWLLRRGRLPAFPRFARPAGEDRQIRVLERVALTPQHSLHLVKVVDTFLVVAVSPSGCHPVASLPGGSFHEGQPPPKVAGLQA